MKTVTNLSWSVTSYNANYITSPTHSHTCKFESLRCGYRWFNCFWLNRHQGITWVNADCISSSTSRTNLIGMWIQMQYLPSTKCFERIGHASKMVTLTVTSSNGNILHLRVTGTLCGELIGERPVTRSVDVFFDLRLNKRLSEQSWSWWSETPSRSLWRHYNGVHWSLLSINAISVPN